MTIDDQGDCINALIDELECHSHGRDEEAEAELIAMGEVVLEALLDRLLGLDVGGQICAIDVITALKSRQAGEHLIALLRSDNEVVRGWSAEALGELGVVEAVPHLRKLLRDRTAAGEPPDWVEAVRARGALTKLGARQPVVPDELKEILFDRGDLGGAVRDPDLERALDVLANADQVVAYYQRWQPYGDTWAAVFRDGESWDLDWTAPWETLVASSHRAAIEAAVGRTVETTFAVTIKWLGAEDWVDL